MNDRPNKSPNTPGSNAGRRVLVTAALPYSNGRLHVGHLAGAYIPADIYVRYLRMTGADVKFICGSDDHGVAIMLTAEKEGKTPASVAEFYREKQAEDFRGVGMSFDIYGGTSACPYHSKTSQDFFLALHEKGFFEKKSSRQFYDDSRSMFLPDRYVKGTCGFCKATGQNGDQCESCGKVLDVDSLKDAHSVISGEPASIRETVHWFLDLSRFEAEVGKWVEKAQIRDQTRAYVTGLLSSGLVNRAMTRDISWGVPVPLDEPEAKDKVLYVWFDAPIGYISFTKEALAAAKQSSEAYADWWKSEDSEVFHFIGEDNTIFHCVIWIAMLIAEGTYSLPTGVIVNQFLNIQFPGEEEQKISKSRGTAVWIGDLLGSDIDIDSLRYYLTMIAPERARTVYKPEDLVQRHNSELGNALGNFVNRVLSFSTKHFGPTIPVINEAKISEADLAFQTKLEAAYADATKQLEEHAFKAALETIMEFCRECNRFVDVQAPWKTKKTDPELAAVTLLFSMRAIQFLGVTLRPFMPNVSRKILSAFSMGDDVTWSQAVAPLAAGVVLTVPEILFKKLEGFEEAPATDR